MAEAEAESRFAMLERREGVSGTFRSFSSPVAKVEGLEGMHFHAFTTEEAPYAVFSSFRGGSDPLSFNSSREQLSPKSTSNLLRATNSELRNFAKL